MASDARWAELGVIEAQLEDETSLQRMAAQTRVLLSTVGPFVDYGEPVRACIEAGTDYIDSMGELQSLELLWAQHAQAAQERGVRLVPSCGFDAIPAELGALYTARRLPTRSADPAVRLPESACAVLGWNRALRAQDLDPPRPSRCPSRCRRDRRVQLRLGP